MVKARVNGVSVTVYDYFQTKAGTICRVKYEGFDALLPVLAALIELSYEA